jgi:CubicO group peptidase (beta-lactamase class C family)
MSLRFDLGALRTVTTAALVLTFIAIPSAVLGQALPWAQPEQVGMSSERLERLDRRFDDYAQAGELSGGVIMVARRGHLVHERAFGLRDLESGAAMRPDDLFRIASQTKAVVSVAAMILIEEGRLLLNDPVSRYLPAFESTTVEEEDGSVVPASRPITIRDLLTHTAGVGYGRSPSWEAAGIQGWYLADRSEPVRATVDRMAALPFRAHPGERWIYGYSTDILGAVLEVAAEAPLDRLLADRLFEPLGMHDTAFYVDPSDSDRLTTVYASSPDGVVRAPDGGGMQAQGQYVDGPRTSLSGGAGLVSTASDYLRFLQMLLNGGELDGNRILAPSSVDLMTRDHVGDARDLPGEGFGLGFSVLEDPGAAGQFASEGRFSWGGAYHTTYWVDPAQELVVVYMTQLLPARLDDHQRLAALVYQSILESGAASGRESTPGSEE